MNWYKKAQGQWDATLNKILENTPLHYESDQAVYNNLGGRARIIYNKLIEAGLKNEEIIEFYGAMHTSDDANSFAITMNRQRWRMIYPELAHFNKEALKKIWNIVFYEGSIGGENTLGELVYYLKRMKGNELV